MARTSDRIQALRSIPMFADLSDRSLRGILQIAAESEAPAGALLIEANREASGLFVIEEGTVVVEAGSKRIEKGAGEFFGELALLTDDAVRTARVRAKTPVRFLAISRADFQRMLTKEPKIALRMLEALAQIIASEIKR